MGKISYEEKMWIQTLSELGLGYRTIAAKFPGNGWKFGSVKLICKRVDDSGLAAVLGDDFTFQQDGAPAHGAKTTQEWLGQHCPNFIGKDCWPPKFEQPRPKSP